MPRTPPARPLPSTTASSPSRRTTARRCSPGWPALIGEDPTLLTNSITPCTYTKVPGKKNRVSSPPNCYVGVPTQPIPVTDQANTVAGDHHPRAAGRVPRRHRDRAEHPQVRDPAGQPGGQPDRLPRQGRSQASTRATRPGSLIGASGIEKQYESALRGTDGVRRLVDRPARQPGRRDQQLSSSTRRQRRAQHRRRRPVADGEGRSRTRSRTSRPTSRPRRPTPTPTRPTRPRPPAVLVNAQTGEIVASASYPSYDPKIFEFPRTQADNAKIAAAEQGPGPPAAQPGDPGPVRAGLDVQADHHLGRAAQRRGQLERPVRVRRLGHCRWQAEEQLRGRGARQDQPDTRRSPSPATPSTTTSRWPTTPATTTGWSSRRPPRSTPSRAWPRSTASTPRPGSTCRRRPTA